MPVNSSSGCGPKNPDGSAAPAVLPAPAPGAVSGTTVSGVPAGDGTSYWQAPSVPAKPTAVDVQTSLDTVYQSLGSAAGAAEDCACKAINRVADALEAARGVAVDMAAGPLTAARDAYIAAAGLAAERAGAERTIAGLSGSDAGGAVAASGKTPDAGVFLKGDDGYGGKLLQAPYATDEIVPGLNQPAPPAVQVDFERQRLGLTGGEDDKKKKKEGKDDEDLPTCPLPTPGKWSVWFDALHCQSLVVAPDTAPPTGGFAFQSEYDSQILASNVAAELQRKAADCLTPGEQVRFPAAPSIWDTTAECQQLAESLKGVSPSDRYSITAVTGFEDPQGNPKLPKGLATYTVLGLSVGALIGAVIRVLLRAADAVVAAVTGAAGGKQGLSNSYMLKAGMGKMIGQWTGIDIPNAYIPDTYAGNFISPQELPSAGEAASLYGAGVVTRETAQCWGRANGRLPQPFDKTLDAQQAVPTAEQALFLERSHTIGPTAAETIIKRNGWLGKNDRMMLEKLSEAQPGVQDVIRFLVRDAGDETLVGRFGMDDDFSKKWDGAVAQYAKSQGVPDGLAKLYWRAHWEIPSPTQLAEFYHRFRHGDANGDNPLALEDVKQALEQQDILPFWIPRYIDASFKPLTRTDTIRAAELGVLDDDAVRRAYWAQGYSDADAETLVTYNRRTVVRRLVNDAGVRSYIRGETDWPTVAAGNPALDAAKPLSAMVKSLADQRRKIRRDASCVRGVRTRFMRGEYDAIEAFTELKGFGIAGDAATDAVGEWKCARRSADLRPTLAQLARWFADGIINTGDYVGRLVRLGYSPADAHRVADTTFADAAARQAKAAAAAAKAAKAPHAKAAKDNQRDKAKQEAAVRRANAERKAAAKSKDARDNRMRGAAGRYAKKAGITAAQAWELVREAYDAALSVVGAGFEEAAGMAAVIAADSWKQGSEDIWKSAAELVQPRSASNGQT